MPTYLDSLKNIDVSQDWKNLFPERNPIDPKPGEFEIGLVLGGTVSAGAYTAGVLDFLIEALDNWEAEKQKNDPATPDWKVTIKVMAGTSGGGVLAATLAKALSWDFPPVSSKPISQAKQNPFYHVWVESLDIKDLLATDDLDQSGNIQSLLNSRCRFEAGNYVANFQQQGLKSKSRSYVAEPLPVFLTLTNLRGIPYVVDWGNGLSQSYVEHADHVRMAVFTKGGNSPVRPDEMGVSDNPLNGFISWNAVSQYALGTSAFPFGLPLQPLSRPVSHYLYRPIIVPGDNAVYDTKIKPKKVDWDALLQQGQTDLDSAYQFLSADGGVMDNEPIELCRRVLSGMTARNPRDGNSSNRAVLLVDPFADAPKLGCEKFTSLGDAAMSLFEGMKDQARYDTQDLLLASQPDCYSRFMITARRGTTTGGRAIASASLGAFGGFLLREFRDHDYFLGRQNCKKFLEDPDGFWLPEQNPLFENWKIKNPSSVSSATRNDSNGIPSLPIIPLFGSSLQNQQVPAYPSGIFDPNANWFQDLLSDRIDKLLDKVNHELVSGFLSRLYVWLGEEMGGKSAIKDAVTQKIGVAISDWGL